MKPILYSSGEQAFDTNGLGILNDAVSCKVTWEKNGQYELTLKYPLDGIHAEMIADDTIILAKPAPDKRPQPFRVYQIKPSSTGMIAANARHVAYDLMGIPAAPFSGYSLSRSLSAMKNSAVVTCPFAFTADFSASGTMTVAVPKAIWELIGNATDSILGLYGGEWEFDRFNVILHQRLGTDTDYAIRYGKNLTTLEQDRNCANVYTGIYPYYADQDGNLTQLYPRTVAAEGDFDQTRIRVVDLSSKFESTPTVYELRLAAQEYILSNDIGVPVISWKIQFVDLAQTEEYKNNPALGTVSWGDTVSVVFPRMRVDASARVVATVYDCLLDRYETITLGSVQTSIADTIVQQRKQAQLEMIRRQQEMIARLKKTAEEAEAKAQELADAAQDAAEEFSKEYTDEAEQDANNYTDAAKQEAKDYADDAADAAGSAALSDAKSYTDALNKMLDAVEVFNRLTDNGAIQGIFKENGKYYFNASHIKTGSLSADLIRTGFLLAQYVALSGKFEVYDGDVLGGHLGYMSGSDGDTTTNGMGMSDPDVKHYVIVTTAGVRMQSGDTVFYINDDGQAVVKVDLLVSGNIVQNASAD